METGGVRITRYVALQDSGRRVNPMIVDGQLHGGAVHGLGNALFEWMGYDENGQPVTTTFGDYLLPSAPEVPMFETMYTESPSPPQSTRRQGCRRSWHFTGGAGHRVGHRGCAQAIWRAYLPSAHFSYASC